VRFDDLRTLNRVLAGLPEIATRGLEQDFVRLFLVACFDGCRHDGALVISVRNRLADELELDRLHCLSANSWPWPYLTAGLSGHAYRECFLGLVEGLVSTSFCLILKLLEIRP
jgi:hypothetical protein